MTVPAARQPIRKYLICYGDENEFWLCDAEDCRHAIEQFQSAGMSGSINKVFECVPVRSIPMRVGDRFAMRIR